MKIVLGAVAALMLGVATMATPAEAACWYNGYGWNCWRPHHHWHHGHPY